MGTAALSGDAQTTAGVLLLTLVAVESGGLYLLGVARGRKPATDFQRAFARAGHAHAGVLVVLALVCQLLLDATELTGLARILARSGVAVAAILMPAGFFLSSAGRGKTAPNRLIVLVPIGAGVLTAGLVTLGVGLLIA